MNYTTDTAPRPAPTVDQLRQERDHLMARNCASAVESAVTIYGIGPVLQALRDHTTTYADHLRGRDDRLGAKAWADIADELQKLCRFCDEHLTD